MENMDGFLHDISEVSPMPLLLFGGKLDAQYNDGTVSIDEWIKFTASKNTIRLISLLRNAIDQLLYAKINNTDYDINSSRILEVVCHLLATDG
jgi:ATP-dependent RNA helicase DHX29